MEMEQNEMKRNKIETALVWQLIFEHFDFASSQLNSQCTKSGEFDNLQLRTYLAIKSATKDTLHVFCRCMHVYT